MDIISSFTVLFVIIMFLKDGDARCSVANFPSKTFTIPEDSPIGTVLFVWQADSYWNISHPDNSSVTGLMDNNVLSLNITGSTDLDSSSSCNVHDTVALTLTCGNNSKVLNVMIKPRNDHKPRLGDSRNIPTSLQENQPTFTPIAEFGYRFEDADCPKENRVFSLRPIDVANVVRYLDGTKYFDIYQNGTLYLKKDLDYETTICGTRSDAKLFFHIVVKDGSRSDPMFIKREIEVINIDDEPPKFVDSSCKLRCATCKTDVYYGNVSYENKGYITVQPPMVAADIEVENISLSEMYYYIANVTPVVYEHIFEINKFDGRIILTESFQNVTNDTVVDDFNVLLSVKAVSNRTALATNIVSLNLTVHVPPEVTTVEITHEAVTTVTSPEVKVTHLLVTPFQKAKTSKKKDYTWVIVVPVVVVVILVVFITAAYCRKRSGLSRKHQYDLDKRKATDLHMNGVQVEKTGS